jgi:hypothetical protein
MHVQQNAHDVYTNAGTYYEQHAFTPLTYSPPVRHTTCHYGYTFPDMTHG